MSNERTYPREWFCVSRWDDKPKAKQFTRETESRLYYQRLGRTSWTPKSGSYEKWFATREEAEAVIAQRRDVQSKAEADIRIRNAAPELLAACEHGARIFRKYEQMHLAKGTEDGKDKAERNRDAAEAMEAAILKAKGA